MPNADPRFRFPGRDLLGRWHRAATRRIADERESWRNHAIAERARHGRLLVLFDSSNGLFSHLANCLLLANWAEARHRDLVFACVGGNYRGENEPDNWLPEILLQPAFDAPRSRAGLEGPHVMSFTRSFDVFPYWRYRVGAPSLPAARALFHRTFALAPGVSRSVEKITAGWKDFFMVGLHYRGTDKKMEAPVVEHDTVITQVSALLAELRRQNVPNARVFVATDDTWLLAKISEALGPLVLTRKEVVRSTDGRALHLSPDIYRGSHLAVEAMIDAVLLSRCSILVKTASFLSGFSAMLAEHQLVFRLNRPFRHRRWFPDAEVTDAAFDLEAIPRAVPAFLAQKPPSSYLPRV